MLRPVPMTRALIVGPRDALDRTVDTLYSMKLLHIVDHASGEDDLEIGHPLSQASEASEILVKLRSIASVLQVSGEPPEAIEEPIVGDLREKILALELNISEEDAAKKRMQALLAELSRKIEEITPFAQLPLTLADYRGYENLDVFVGKVPKEMEGLETVTPEHESFQVAGFLAVFVTKERAAAMRDFLTARGFTSVPVPEGDGDPRDILQSLRKDKERWERRLAEIEERLLTLRERYSGFLTAAKAHLEVLVEKAEAPLRFAVTDHTFIVEGWVPSETFPKLRSELTKMPGLFVTDLEQEHPAEGEGDAPVLLRNVRPLRPFEMLVKLFSVPSYREIDPTFIIAVAFPIFFGLMIGDAGYGVAWLAVGFLLLAKVARKPGAFRDLVIAITWGGFWSLLFGLFFFAEAFGIPFHHSADAATRVELLDWSAILGFSIPIEAQMHKLEQVPDFIVLSIVAAFLHLLVAFVVGFANDIGHNRKHALGKISWILILTGLFTVIMARTARWPDIHGHTPYGYTIWHGPLGWFPKYGMEYLQVGFGPGNPIPWLSIALLVGGLGLLLVTEGALHVMEFFGLTANVVSYARLAAVGVAKAAMAFAFNVIALDTAIFPGLDTGNVFFVIVGIVVAVLFHLIIFLLGAVTAAIQAIRLNYVEFFVKFFKGAGTEFRPFGERAKPEV